MLSYCRIPCFKDLVYFKNSGVRFVDLYEPLANTIEKRIQADASCDVRTLMKQ